MSSYKTGRIYKIIHNQSNLVYVGSTFDVLAKRWQRHKKHFNEYLENKKSVPIICKYFKEFGIENFKIILIKEYQVIDRKHMEIYEQLWINKLKPCNKVNPIAICKLKKKQRVKQYYEDNKKKIKEKAKIYYEKNKEEIKKKTKIYASQKVKCEICNYEFRRDGLTKHNKSKKHLANLN